MLEAKFGDDPLPPFQLPLLIVILFLILWIALSLVSTRRLKTIKGAKIESCKGDGVNRLVCMLGNKLFSHLIAFKRQKKAIADIKKKLLLAITDQRVPTYFMSSWEFFLLKLEKNCVTRRFYPMFITCLFKQGRNLYTTLVKIDFVKMPTNKKWFTVLNENEILAEEVKMFPCLHDKGSRSYWEREMS